MPRDVIRLGLTRGVGQPSYALQFFRDGDPTRPIRGVNLRSVIAIQTAKGIQDLAGTFTITLKDKRARHAIREMDAVRIRLKGHDPRYVTVIKGVVDSSRPAGAADPHGSTEDTVITGRCVAKYVQVNSLFLPVWDPEALLPTALTFGVGDAAKKVGGNTVYDINRYLVRRFVYGASPKSIAGTAGTPAARHWLDYRTRVSRSIDFQVPFLQFDENSMGEAFKRFEILGFTETWIDEIGRMVFRRPQWDAPISYSLPTAELIDWSFPTTDEAVATYCEVIPAGDPGIDSSMSQALRAGRAPVPSSYLQTATDSTLTQSADPEFIIDTDARGRVTARGRRNKWYRLQRRLGVRPQQISSPLIFTQEQAQAQAEGLLRFHSRMSKTCSVTIPGCPTLRLGHNIRIHGELEGQEFDRVFYLEHVAHDYVEGSHYRTHFQGTHGRDKGEAKWGNITLPKFSPQDLVDTPGILSPTAGNGRRARIVAIATRSMTVNSGFSRYSQPGVLTDDPTPRTGRSDCSQWIRACYLQAGAPDPGVTTYAMAANGTRTRRPKPGDIMLTADNGHAELYIGDGKTIGHGSAPIDTASVSDFPGHYFVTVL